MLVAGEQRLTEDGLADKRHTGWFQRHGGRSPSAPGQCCRKRLSSSRRSPALMSQCRSSYHRRRAKMRFSHARLPAQAPPQGVCWISDFTGNTWTMVWVLLAVAAFAILTQKPFCAMVLFHNYVSAQC